MDILSYSEFLGNRESVYFLRQVLTVLGLFTAGLLPAVIIRKRLPDIREMLFSFPLGLSIFGVSGFLLLISGVGLSVQGIIVVYLVLMAVPVFFRHLKPDLFPERKSDPDDIKRNAGLLSAGIITAVIIAFFSCSGFLTQNVTNDSVYYYSMYPSILVHDGVITASLDKYLTDVGQTTAVIQCLPFLFGYDESFGIQHFLNLNFILIFFMSLYETLCKPVAQRGIRIVAAFLGTLFLVSSEPFIVMSKWVLSNVYFMEFLFLVVYLIYKAADDGENSDVLRDLSIILMTAFLVMSRMEGGVLVFVTAVAFSALPMKKGRLLLYFGLPLVLMEIGYYGMIYLKVGIDPLYSFLDMKSALLMVAMIVALLVYIIFIRNHISLSLVPIMLLSALLIGNAGLLAVNHSRYITNIKAFMLNIRQGNGWGIFAIIIVIYSGILLFEMINRKCKDLPLMVFLPAALVLSIFAVCFARGGVLAVRTSDSGNRVLMETVPLLFFSVYIWCISAVSKEGKNEMSYREAGEKI